MAESPTLFEARSAPLQSLSAGGFRIVAGVLVAGFGFTGTVFSILGAWPVLPFAGIETALVLGLMALYRRHARRSAELVVLTEGELCVTRREGRRQEEAHFDPSWVRLAWVDDRQLFLVHRNRRIEIGRFLGPDEKRDLEDALAGALRRFRTPVFDNPQLRTP